MTDRRSRSLFAGRLAPRGNRGLSLMEVAVTVLIIGMAVTAMLQTDVNTVDKARRARMRLSAALLAQQLLAMECTAELPTEVGDSLGSRSMTEVVYGDERFTDEESGQFPYRGFFYEVEKEYEEINPDSDLSLSAEEREEEELYGELPVDGEEPATLGIVRIRVTVFYPRIDLESGSSDDELAPPGDAADDFDTVVLETYVRAPDPEDAPGAVPPAEG